MRRIAAYEEADEADVVALWQTCDLVVPWNDPVKDIQRKLRVQRDLFLVGFSNGRLVASVMSGYEGHRGWINYLAATLPRPYGKPTGGCESRSSRAPDVRQ